MSRQAFWFNVLVGIVGFVLGSTVWQMVFVPKLKEMGYG